MVATCSPDTRAPEIVPGRQPLACTAGAATAGVERVEDAAAAPALSTQNPQPCREGSGSGAGIPEGFSEPASPVQSALHAEAARPRAFDHGSHSITLVTLPVPRLSCLVVTGATASRMLFGSAVSEGKLRPREKEPSHSADGSVGSQA